MDTREFFGLIGFLGLCTLPGLLGGMATASSVGTWYQELAKPAWTPPGWIFGPVWTLLYAMMGVAAWRVWREAGWDSALAVFGVQLALNTAWSFLFFGWRSPFAGLLGIGLLWIAIAVTMFCFFRLDRLAGWLLIPYLCWVTFAAVLNFSIWNLNR